MFHVDQEHLARLQAPLLDDLLFRNRQYAGLGSHDHEVIVGDQITGRTQTVTIERRADLATISEGHGGRAVPRLHHGSMVFVEGATVFVHRRVLFPGFRDHQHDGLGQRVPTTHDEQLERIVEGCRVRLPRVMQRPYLLQVFAENRRRNRLFTRLEPVDVAAHRVDFAVVGDVAERVRQIPGREGIGRETLVHQCQGGSRALVLKIEVIHTNLIGQQQALVVHRARREGRHIELLTMLQLQRLDGIRSATADDVQLALKGIGHEDIRTATDEDLADHRFLGAHCRRHRHFGIDRHIAPAQYDLAFGLD